MFIFNQKIQRNVERIPFDEMVRRCVSGGIEDAKTVAAVLRAKVLLDL